jgi:hypothetical protein
MRLLDVGKLLEADKRGAEWRQDDVVEVAVHTTEALNVFWMKVGLEVGSDD